MGKRRKDGEETEDFGRHVFGVVGHHGSWQENLPLPVPIVEDCHTDIGLGAHLFGITDEDFLYLLFDGGVWARDADDVGLNEATGVCASTGNTRDVGAPLLIVKVLTSG
jgi:hypothetical protein